MKNKTLKEIAKFAAGVVVADIVWLLWFWQQGMSSMQFLGFTMTAQMVIPSIVFEAALFLILVHYAWHIGKIPAVRERTYIVVVGAIFTVVAIIHLWRLFTGSDIVILGWDAPLWLSWIGVAVTSYLAYASFHLSMKLK